MTPKKVSTLWIALAGIAMVAVLLITLAGSPTVTVALQAGTPSPTPFPIYSGDPRVTGGSIQRFQFGYMVWIQDTRQVYALVDPSSKGWGGTVEIYSDTWTEGMQDTDPSLVPPAGQQQPNRGLGKVWRETAGLRDRLGFAWEPSQAFTALIYTTADRTYLSTNTGWVIRIVGSQWQRVDVWNLGYN
ncbi:MAG: hypothetical protein IT322_14900 [Anaerolineae bacterium]|nr:hypothetical protein [Anaerolineae bacterium]